MKKYNIKEYGIIVTVNLGSGKIVSKLLEKFVGYKDSDLRGRIDAIEALILGHACAGIDISSPAYVVGLRSALDAIANNV